MGQTVVDATGPWWVDVAVALSGFGAVFAAILAFVGIRQAGALQAERTRERNRERLEDKIRALNDALESLVKLRETARLSDYPGATLEQKRLRIAAARASSQTTHDLETVAKINYTDSEDQRNQLMQSCDGAIDKVVWEIGELAKGIEQSSEPG